LLIIFLKRKINKDNLNFIIFVLIGVVCLFMTHNKSTIIWNTLPFMKYIQFPWRFLGVAVFSFSLSCGLIVKEFKKYQLLVSVLIILLTVTFNFNFFRPDIWYNFSDHDLETGQQWDISRFASIGDYWPNFGHKIPDKISDGKYINYFPGWNYLPDKNGLIPSQGAVFSNTPIRTIGNIVSLISFSAWFIFYIRYGIKRNNRN